MFVYEYYHPELYSLITDIFIRKAHHAFRYISGSYHPQLFFWQYDNFGTFNGLKTSKLNKFKKINVMDFNPKATRKDKIKL